MVKICSEPYPNNSKYDSHFELYPYDLSDFQKYAIEAIVEGNHVLVTAHTGSGKTLPAEFAIQHFHKLGKKTIYTSPIKALSNQKYYEFTQKYPHISFGLFTGDIKTNPCADVLIMTTEILMNYLFMGQGQSSGQCQSSVQGTTLSFQIDIERELACVVFDEVHYINDAHRGQVWEQTILMLPRQIQMVMLSATIDAPERFAKWVEDRGSDLDHAAKTDDPAQKNVYLASTSHRQVPLTHYSYITTPESTFKSIKDKTVESTIRASTNTLVQLQSDRGIFQEQNHLKIKKVLSIFEEKNLFAKRKHVLNNLTLFLREKEMLPAIAFVFSRKHVELCAREITTPLLEDDSKIPYIVRRECEQIVRKLPNFREYLELPEYVELCSLLEKGIGIHHSGMIPILREIVEIMISKKYIKLLFATESFAIGLDCPIKTAIFVSLTKFDGTNERLLMSHEYTQMAGRAGRRGIDTVGHVVHCNNLFDMPTMTDYKRILGGTPQTLVSKFHINYSMVLNVLKAELGQESLVNFAKKSMINLELNQAIEASQKKLELLEQKIKSEQMVAASAKTPQDICRKYAELEQMKQMTVNKKRRETEKELASIIDQYHNIKTDVTHYFAMEESVSKRKQELEHLEYFMEYINDNIGAVCSVLNEYDIINADLTLTTIQGQIAANLAEVHPVIMATLMTRWNNFDDFSPKQLACLFSCFTDVKVDHEQKKSLPITEDAFLKMRVLEMSELFQKFDAIENKRRLQTGLQYEDALMYDLIDEVGTWADLETEAECKWFIQTKIAEKSISIGDYTKAILKIGVITKEFINIAEQMSMVSLQHKLTQIEPMIMKYITMSQSLYV
jgi:superfamily II RNA helicase